MKRVHPDFVIVGAPKCGTTAVHSTLARHSQLFFSLGIKEPHFFAFDYPKRREVETLRDYDRLFDHAKDAQLTGEASVYYLSSQAAVAAILARRPDAKFIAFVRNPVEMFVSLHNENLKALDEDQENPEQAWALQDQRARGEAIPRLCKERSFLQYRTLCGLGAQVQRLFDLVPREQRLVIIFEDLQHDPRRVFRQITDFLGVEDNGSLQFVQENAFARHRWAFVASFARLVMVSRLVKRLRLRLKPVLNGLGLKPLAWAVRGSLRRVAKPVLSPEFRDRLQVSFRPDIDLLGDLLGRDLSHWYASPDAAPGCVPELQASSSYKA